MTNEQHTYWVSIGRNVGADPMSDQRWDSFQRAARSIFYSGPEPIIAEIVGTSSWDGAIEDTYAILVTVYADDVPWIRGAIARLARTYDQDGIGFVGGPGTDTYISAR